MLRLVGMLPLRVPGSAELGARADECASLSVLLAPDVGIAIVRHSGARSTPSKIRLATWPVCRRVNQALTVPHFRVVRWIVGASPPFGVLVG